MSDKVISEVVQWVRYRWVPLLLGFIVGLAAAWYLLADYCSRLIAHQFWVD